MAGRGSIGNVLDFAAGILSLDFCTAGQDLVTDHYPLVLALRANPQCKSSGLFRKI